MQALYDAKSLESDTYEGYRSFVASVIRTPGGTAFWDELKVVYLPKMVTSIDTRMHDGNLFDLLNQPQWKSDVPSDA
jgi:hypothetical protein